GRGALRGVVRGSLDVPDPRVEQLAGGALEVLAGGPRAPVLGVGGARDRVHDGRLGVARLHVPGPLQPLDHLVGGDAGDVDGAIAYQGLVDCADVIDAAGSPDLRPRWISSRRCGRRSSGTMDSIEVLLRGA